MDRTAPLPDPRRYPGQRGLRIAARTVHIGAAGMLLGAAAFHQPADPWWEVVMFSGLVIVGDDLFKWGPLYLRMVQFWVVALKLSLVVFGGLHPDLLLPALWVVLVCGSVVSHMPGRFRHRRLV